MDLKGEVVLKSQLFGKSVLTCLVFLGMGSCGPARSVPLNEEDLLAPLIDTDTSGLKESPSPAQALGLRIGVEKKFLRTFYSSTRDGDRVYLAQNVYPMRTTQNEIYLNRALPFSPSNFTSKNIFFAFTQDLLQSTIINASVSHALISGSNQKIYFPDSYIICHDLNQNIWLVSVTDILKKSFYLLSEVNTHIFLLNLTLANSLKIEIKIYFRIVKE